MGFTGGGGDQMFCQSAVISPNMETSSLRVSPVPVCFPYRVGPGGRAHHTRGDLCNTFPGPDGGVEGVGSGRNLPEQSAAAGVG